MARGAYSIPENPPGTHIGESGFAIATASRQIVWDLEGLPDAVKVGLSATEQRALEPHLEAWINGFCLLLPVGLGNGVGWRSLSLGGATREGDLLCEGCETTEESPIRRKALPCEALDFHTRIGT